MHGLHPLEDRRRRDRVDRRGRKRRLVSRVRRDHARDDDPDGVALAAPARGAGRPGAAAVAESRLPRLVYGGPDPSDGDRRRRDADVRDDEASSGTSGTAAGSVLLERALGGAATLTLGAVGFLLAIGRYDVGAYLWIELLFVVGTIVAGVLLFSRRLRRPLARSVQILRPLRLERPVRAVYEGIHAYRSRPRLLAGVFALTVAVQAVRVLAIWGAGEAVGIDLSPRIYYVMGPLFFLVMLVPFTLNGLAVREAFFVSFLGSVGVDADTAFAAGFLFFLVTVAMALPGGAILAWEGLRASPRPTIADG
jgi:hypothetical protein